MQLSDFKSVRIKFGDAFERATAFRDAQASGDATKSAYESDSNEYDSYLEIPFLLAKHQILKTRIARIFTTASCLVLINTASVIFKARLQLEITARRIR